MRAGRVVGGREGMRRGLAVALLGALCATGCFVNVSHVSNPEPAFRKAREEAESLAGRKGPARSVQILVYDPGDQELVRVSMPMWVARRLSKEADWDEEEGGETVRRALHGRLKWSDLERSALGTLVEVEEEDGEQVLVWLR
jgi:hypothetical protein